MKKLTLLALIATALFSLGVQAAPGICTKTGINFQLDCRPSGTGVTNNQDVCVNGKETVYRCGPEAGYSQVYGCTEANGNTTWYGFTKTTTCQFGCGTNGRCLPRIIKPLPVKPILVEVPVRPGIKCDKEIEVTNMHYPDKTCAQSKATFLATMMQSYHFTSKCPARTKLLAVKNVSCQDAPIPGFNSGSVYKGVACCGNTSPAPEVKIIPAYPMQGGAYTTPCPVVGVEVPRAGLATHTYYMNFSVSVQFDGACANSFGTGFKAVSLKTVSCAPDSRGPGFGPNNKADLKCSK